MNENSECPRCQKRGKTWNGSDPVCAFINGQFSRNNWNCATMNEIRERADGKYCDDHYMALLPWEDSGGLYILLGWYKRRGRTDLAQVVDIEGVAVNLSLEQAELFLSGDSEREI